MDLSFGQEYEAFREEVRGFLKKHGDKSPRNAPMRSPQTLEWQKLLIEHGYTARTIPEEYGGFGAEPDIIKSRIIAEEFADARANSGLGGQGISMLVPTLLEMGTQEQKQQFIKPTIHGEMVWCQGYSEPGSGSDLASLKTKAERDGEHYVVNGQKIWTTQAHWADWIFCLVRTSSEGKAQEGISFLLIDMKTSGIEVKPIYSIDGEHHLNEVYFTDVRVPVSNLVGEENNGWTYAKFLLMNERIGIAGTDIIRSGMDSIKIMHDHLSETAGASYDGQAIARRYAELGVRLEALEMLEARALTAAEGSGESMVLPLPLKLLGTDLQQDMADLSVDILGDSALPRVGYGFGEGESGNQPNIREQGPATMRSMLSGRASTIYGGTSEVQRGIMSKFVLGL